MDAASSPTSAPHTRIARPVSPEIAAHVREAGEAVAATVRAGEAIVKAATDAARIQLEQALAHRTGAYRAILRQQGFDDAHAMIVATEGAGAETVIIIEVTPAEEASHG